MMKIYHIYENTVGSALHPLNVSSIHWHCVTAITAVVKTTVLIKKKKKRLISTVTLVKEKGFP